MAIKKVSRIELHVGAIKSVRELTAAATMSAFAVGGFLPALGSHRSLTAVCKRHRKRAQFAMESELLVARKKVASVLARDLQNQYTAPSNLDWSIYATNISFDDPMTKLKGKLLYKVLCPSKDNLFPSSTLIRVGRF